MGDEKDKRDFNQQISVICYGNQLKEKVLPLLLDTVFHVTSLWGYQGILKDHLVKPNIGNQFPYTFPQSANSYGLKKGYICLFDLRNQTDEIIQEALMKFYFLNPFRNKNKSVYLILSPESYADLIDYTVAKKEVGYKGMWIPYVECWYPTTIPLERIEKIINVTVSSEVDDSS